MTEKNAVEEVPVFKNPSYSASAASSANLGAVFDSASGPVGSSFADRARAAELASQNERLDHELREGEATLASGSASSSGIIRLKRNKNNKFTKRFDSADMNSQLSKNSHYCVFNFYSLTFGSFERVSTD